MPQLDFNDVKLTCTLDNLRIHVTQINYGVFTTSYPKHRHGTRYYELHLVCGGKGALVADDTPYPLETGTLYMTGPRISHEQITDSSDYMSEYCLGFELSAKRGEVDTPAGRALAETHFWIGTDSGRCAQLFELLEQEAAERLIGYINNAKNIVSLILIELVRHYTGNERGFETARVTPDDRRMTVIDHCFLHRCADLTEDQLGEILGLSHRQVQRFLKKAYGKTFSQLRREARLNRAEELMKRGMKIEDAGAAVGYTSASFFRKIWREYCTTSGANR